MLDLTFSGLQGPSAFFRPGLDENPEALRTIRDEILRDAGLSTEAVVTDLSHLGIMSLRLDRGAVQAVLKDRRVRSVGLLPPLRGFLAETAQQSNFGYVQSAGFDGSGVVVAVIDNGFSQGGSNPHPNVPVVPRQACYCETHKGVGCCANGATQEVGPNAGRYIGDPTGFDPTELSQVHGTSVIATMLQTVPGENGLAYGVSPLLINIGGSTSTGSPGQGTSGYTGLGFLNALASMQTGEINSDVQIVNMSFGDYRGFEPITCVGKDNQASSQLISSLHGQGIAFIAAAGNGGSEIVAWPACLPEVISVAAAWNQSSPSDPCVDGPVPAGQTTCYSNRNAYIDLAAAGSVITLANSRFNTGAFDHNVVPRNGTSFAAPVAASCAVRLKQANPGISPEALRTALSSSPTTSSLVDYGFSKPLLDCAQALAVSGAPLIPIANAGLSGAWYEPRTAGQGFYINMYPALGKLWVGWFTFENSGSGSPGRRWYSLQEIAPYNAASTSLNLAILQTTGGQFDAPPALGAPTQVGTAALSFTSCTAGTLQFQFDNNGPSGTIPLTRLDVPYCNEAAGGSLAGDINYTGLWHDGDLPGQGLVFRVMPAQQKVVGAWFTYDSNAVSGPDGQDWFAIDNAEPGIYQPPASQYDAVGNTVDFFFTQGSGGVFNAPPTVTASAVGTGTLTFTSCNSATLHYDLDDGRDDTIYLTRVGPAFGSCD